MFTIARLSTDTLIFIVSYMAAYQMRFGQFSPHAIIDFPFGIYVGYIVAIVVVYVSSFYLWGQYKPRKGFLIEIDEFVENIVAILSAWVIVIVLSFIKGEYTYSRPIIMISLPITAVLIVVVRQLILRLEMSLRSRGYMSRKAAVIGSGELAQQVAFKIKSHPSYGYFYVGTINGGKDSIGGVDDIEALIDRHGINAVFVADTSLDRKKLAQLADICDQKGVGFGTLPDVFQILTTSPTVEDIDGLPMVSLKQIQLNPFNRFIKRGFDIVMAAFGIIVFAVPMVIISAVIKLTSPGPVIYAQKRVGRKGTRFALYKFRTMKHKAEKGTGAVLATEDDPRKTYFGKFLRSTNLDELPQLFNILKGDMSFVGPRPERPKFVSQFKEEIPKYMERHKINVGLAGWAQMQDGGYHMSAEEKLKYDLFYIENWSLLLDLKIILKCAEIAFTRKRIN